MLSVYELKICIAQASYTPLISAAFNGSLDVVDLLIQYGANVEAKNKVCFCPIFLGTTCIMVLYCSFICVCKYEIQLRI